MIYIIYDILKMLLIFVRTEWVITDLAAVWQALVSVPIHFEIGTEMM